MTGLNPSTTGLTSREALAKNEDVRRDANTFVLHMLLQRLESQQPGLLQGMIDGILGDRTAMPASSEPDSYAQRVGDEALRILNLANDQMKIPWQPLRKD